MHSLFEDRPIGDVKDFAERLRSRLQAKHGFALGHGKMLHLLAEINGFDAWAAFEKQLGFAVPTNTKLNLGKPKTEGLSLGEDSRILKSLITYTKDVGDLMDRRHSGIDSRIDREAEPRSGTIETPYGAVEKNELAALIEHFDDLGGSNTLSGQLLKAAKQMEECYESSFHRQIIDDVVVLAEVLDTVLNLEKPTVPTSRVGMSVGAFAQKVFDDASWLTEDDGDGPVSDLMDILEYVTRLDPR